MKICYIPPKTTRSKRRVVKLYSSSLTDLLLILSSYRDPELTFILLVCLILAIIAAGQQAWMGHTSKAQREYEKMDNQLKEWERKKKIEKMCGEMEEEQKGVACKNVDTTNLI